MNVAGPPPRSSIRRTSVWQPRRPAFWFYVAILGATGTATVTQQSLFRQISPSGWALSWGLLALYALPVVIVVYLLDLYEREPMPLMVGALLWGAIAATTLSGLANDGWGLVVARIGGPEFAARWTAALTAPVVEETLKGIGVVMIFLIAPTELDDVMDGFVYGAVCGLGFAVVEDVVYLVAVFGGSPREVITGFFARVLAGGLYSHVLYTGLVGMAIGYVVSRRDDTSRGRRLATAAGLSAVAVLAHFLWNSPLLDLFPTPPFGGIDWLLIPLATAAKGAPLLGFVAAAVVLARRRERRWIGSVLAAEADSIGVSALELDVLRDPRRRRAARRNMRVRAGNRAAGLLARLQREQVNLAMIRSKVADADDPILVRQREYCRSLRNALEAMPGAAPADMLAADAPPAADTPPAADAR